MESESPRSPKCAAETFATGAYLDESRGTLRVTDVDPSEYKNSLFPDGVYHLYDYQFFFRNLQENVGVRLASFLQKAK